MGTKNADRFEDGEDEVCPVCGSDLDLHHGLKWDKNDPDGLVMTSFSDDERFEREDDAS